LEDVVNVAKGAEKRLSGIIKVLLTEL